MSDILRVTMLLDEEKLGCFIVAYYDTDINYNIILEAVHDYYYELLHYIWAFGKNVYDSTEKSPVFISYNVLFDIIRIINEKEKDQEKECIERVVNWLVITDDNILISLLSHEYDDLALQYIGYYVDDINVDLLLYCLKFGNEKFLKGALKLSAFDKLIFRESKVMNQIISLLKSGLRIIYLLNIMTLVDFSILRSQHLKDLIDVISSYEKDPLEENKLLQSYNPIMTICLAADILIKVGNSRK